jgi:hypothetical protein
LKNARRKSRPTPRLVNQRFEYFNDGPWGVDDGDPTTPFDIPLFDTDTAAAGMQIDLKLTGPDTYQLTIKPLGMAATYSQLGLLKTPGEPIDWLEFTFFNTRSQPGLDTDFFIRSIQIIGVASPRVPGDYNHNGIVDAADYSVWRDSLGRTGSGLAVDGNGDGMIDRAC